MTRLIIAISYKWEDSQAATESTTDQKQATGGLGEVLRGRGDARGRGRSRGRGGRGKGGIPGAAQQVAQIALVHKEGAATVV